MNVEHYIGYQHKGSKTRMMELSDGWKSFKIDLAVWTQYQRVTDRHHMTAKTALCRALRG